jgi:hypothetical protein
MHRSVLPCCLFVAVSLLLVPPVSPRGSSADPTNPDCGLLGSLVKTAAPKFATLVCGMSDGDEPVPFEEADWSEAVRRGFWRWLVPRDDHDHWRTRRQVDVRRGTERSDRDLPPRLLRPTGTL